MCLPEIYVCSGNKHAFSVLDNTSTCLISRFNPAHMIDPLMVYKSKLDKINEVPQENISRHI